MGWPGRLAGLRQLRQEGGGEGSRRREGRRKMKEEGEGRGRREEVGRGRRRGSREENEGGGGWREKG